ncbi:MAG: SpoIID/LytB domain-containing protein, partial [Candidatus Hydrogenedentes bacterium]|nr:SpoIID/LytB domain-containing protein [Candidatus Hydrogenedentota bacterium]
MGRRDVILRRFAPALPIVMLLAACGVASLVLSSCRRFVADVPVPQKPLKFEGVPTVRVRITGKSVKSAELSTTGGYRILVDGREVGRSTGPLPKTFCKRRKGRWTMGMLTVSGTRLSLIGDPSGDPESLVGYGKKLYRGRLVAHADGEDRFFVHNNVNMESYLASVVARELYPNFHPEAYRAQTVAARTYALYEIATRGQRSSFDVWDSQRSQVYGGMSAETNRSWAAVRDTHAEVLAYGPPGSERIFLTQFSACNGGYV